MHKMGRLKNNIAKIVYILTILIVFMGSMGTAFAIPVNVSSCQDITLPGEYVLNQSITESSADPHCIGINSSDVIFDGQGYTIDGQDTVNTKGLFSYNASTVIKNITIKNVLITDWDHGIYVEDAENNTIGNNTLTSNINGISIISSTNNSVLNNTASTNKISISLNNSSDNTLLNNTISNDTLWDYSSISNSGNNTVTNLSIGPIVSFTGRDIAIKSASSPASVPAGYAGIGKYINITNNSADSWILLNISYNETDIASVNESSLRVWKYNGSWSQVPSTNGVETSGNYVYSNITSFSIFAPLAYPDNTPPDVSTLYTSPSSIDTGSSVNITVSVTDDHLNSSSVFAIVEHPDGFINTSLTALSNGNNYFINYTNTSVYGRYNVTINASDYAGNINNTEKTWFVTKKTFNSIIRIHGEGNGTLSNSSGIWNPVNFPALITGETLNIMNISSRVIPQNGIWYNTSKEIVRYKINEYNSSKFVEYALDQNGLKQANGGYYAKIGWQGISYIALNGTANKLAILLLEQGNSSSDKKTISVGDLWEMGDGFTLIAKSIDVKSSPRQVWLELSKDGVKLDDMILAQGDVYSYSQSVAGESNVPIFTTYINSIFAGAYSDYVQFRYTWSISNNITNITQGEVYGNFTVNLSTSAGINLTNSNNITLSQNSTVNLMDRFYFNVTNNTSLEYYPYFTTPTSINASEADVSLDILTNSGIAGIIDISKMKDLPPGINRSIGLTPFGKYISINATQNIVDNIDWALIKIYYSEDELTESGFNESSLNISRLNETTSEWEVLNKTSLSWVNDAGLNTTGINGYSGFVWANVSRLSYYGIGKPIPIVTPTPTSTPTPSQNSGGDDVTDDTTLNETNTNIEIKEKQDLYIYKDSLTSYRFLVSYPILFVNITGNVNAGKITTTVEILKTISPFVKEPPPGTIYKNVNIRVGTNGFAVPKNIKDALIKFRVKKSWLSENNILKDEIYLLIWDGDSWNRLETVVSGTDDSYIYMESRTQSFSNFAISGLRDTKAPVPPATPVTGTKQLNTNTSAPGFEENGWIIISIGVSLISTAGYYYTIRKGWYKKL